MVEEFTVKVKRRKSKQHQTQLRGRLVSLEWDWNGFKSVHYGRTPIEAESAYCDLIYGNEYLNNRQDTGTHTTLEEKMVENRKDRKEAAILLKQVKLDIKNCKTKKELRNNKLKELGL